MIKRLILSLLIMTMLIAVVPTMAIDDVNSGPQSLARYFAPDTVLFAAMRVDDGFIDELDQFSARAFAAVPPELLQTFPELGESVSLRDTLQLALKESGMVQGDLDSILAWLGDNAAIGMMGGLNDENFQAVVELADRDEFMSFVEANATEQFMTEEQDGFTLYTSENDTTVLAVNDELLVATSDMRGFQAVVGRINGEPDLSDLADFRDIVTNLTESSYNAFAYLDLQKFLVEIDDPDALAMLGVDPATAGSMAIGWTITDATTSIVDVIQTGFTGSWEGVDPTFMRFVPANSGVVFHARNLSGFFKDLITIAEAGSPGSSEQLKQGLQMFQMDIQEDIMSWTTGDYAVFARLDLAPIVMGFAEGQITIDGNYSFGFVIEATDPAKAQVFSEKLSGLVMLMQGQGFTAGTENINGVPVTILSAGVPVDAFTTVTIDLAFGVTDEVFFFGTKDIASAIITGDGVMVKNPAYLNAREHMLDNANFVTYTTGEGFISVIGGATVATLTLMGPVIGDVFENIIQEMESPGQASAPQAMTVQSMDEIGQIVLLLEYMNELIESVTVSTAVSDGVWSMRMTFSYADN